jgi:carboxymethylenebutenolidase
MTTRRDVIRTLAGLPLAAVLADSRLVAAAASELQSVHIRTASGKEVTGALALPQGEARGGILLVHEWWGLNDQIKSVAAELAKEGYVALACDLYNGNVTADRTDARALMQAVDRRAATETVTAWINWLKERKDTRNRIATIGWCFGGGWSLNASLAAPVNATVVYYGNVRKDEFDLESLNGPVLGHYATEDQWINREMVNGFEEAMRAAGKTYTSHWYEAKHAFANPTSARYDDEDAALAWSRSLDFLRDHL